MLSNVELWTLPNMENFLNQFYQRRLKKQPSQLFISSMGSPFLFLHIPIERYSFSFVYWMISPSSAVQTKPLGRIQRAQLFSWVVF